MLNSLLFSFISLLPFIYALPEVKLGKTTVSGRAVSDKVDFFGGIPFAEPPVGPLRLRKPVLKTRLATPSFNASTYGKSCIQPLADPTTLSEDCLTINIFRPAGVSSKEKLPVLFWTYGGGFIIGSSNMYDGSNLVARSVARGTPIVYVNFNYRLGPLGYPIGQEADDKRALNLALHDQTTALEWVQANIHLFGGDKSKVTIFGESAGAMMTGVQFLNPQLGKLARGAIFESGQANGPGTFPASRNEPVWQRFVGNVASCASIASSGKTFDCLKNATTEEITASVLASISLAELPWIPTVDTGKGSIFPDYASKLYAQGRFAKLPFIAGNNLDEGTLFAAPQEMTDVDFKAMIVEGHSPPTVSQQALEEVADKLLELYPDDPTVGSPYGTGDELFGLPRSFKRSAALMGDMTFVAARRQWNQVAARFGVRSYGYHFTHPQNPASQLGVAHAAEIPFVYGQVPPSDSAGQSLSSLVMDYWISFTVSLTPNDGKGIERPNWPRYTERDQWVLRLEGGNTTAVKDDFRKEQLAFLTKNAFVLRRIPFAEPPVGPLRLSRPILRTQLHGSTFDASAYGKSCIQPAADPSSISEDCLTVNVYRPAGISSKEKIPVLFWAYGGGFIVGSSSQFDGASLVTRSISRGTPMIYVNFNYRVGPLGFPQGQESDDRRALNLGIYDQLAALQWVQENIHFFGGDKSKVTVSGVSAGASLTAVQLLNPQIEKLVRGAILQSGSPNGLRTHTAARNEPIWQGFVGNVASCANISTSGRVYDCLKLAPIEEIFTAVMQSAINIDFPWDPTLDVGEGSVLQDYPSSLYAKGHFAGIPFIAGTNLDEGTFFAQLQERSNPLDLKTWILTQHSPPTVSQQALEDVADKLLELYPDDPALGSPFGTGDELFGLPSSFKRRAALVGDMWFIGRRRQWSQTAAHFGVKSYAYQFTQPQGAAQPQLGVTHGAEVPYIFSQVPSSDAAGQSLSVVMMDYWISFTVSLSPNDGKGAQRPVWPQYTEKNQVLLQLEAGNVTTVQDDFREEQINYLNENSLILRR